MVSEPLHYARDYVAKGLSVIPIGRGTKEPAYQLLPLVYDEASGKEKHSWGMYQERYPEPEELVAWFVGAENGIAIVCGTVSGGLVVLDVESVELYERWRKLAEALLDLYLLDQLPVVATDKGRHVYFRMPEPVGNRRLAMDGKKILAETRGQGGCAVAPPTVHPSGARYTLINGDLGAIPLLDTAQAQALLDAARALAPPQEHPASKPTGTAGKTGGAASGNDVIGAFNRARSIEVVLEAHGYVRTRSGSYIRPGGGHGSVIIVSGKSIHFNPADDLYSEAPGGGNHAHTPFSAFCILDHGGDVRAAVREAARGLGLNASPWQGPGSSGQPRQDAVLAEAGRVLGLDEEGASWPYFEEQGGVWMHQRDRDGAPKAPMPLCNFLARIVAETVVDDGEHQEEWYTLRAVCQGRTREIELRRTEFESESALSRIVAALGARARVNPRTQPKYVLDAIKAFSAEVTEQVVHTHTGWVDGRYLLANGYVDAQGWHQASGCQLPRRLQTYSLAPEESTIADGLARLDDLLALAPAKVMVPLLGGVLLGPIGATIDSPAPMVHPNGPTGCHKTSICCAAMGLAGAFLPAHPTDSWTSTANSIQRLGWHLKDAPMLLDDYKAAHVKAQHVTFLLQNYGDNMARGRLDANSDVRSTFPMRCVLISSGEDQPEGEASTLARILSVPLARREVDRGRRDAQREPHRLASPPSRWAGGGGVRGAAGHPALVAAHPTAEPGGPDLATWRTAMSQTEPLGMLAPARPAALELELEAIDRQQRRFSRLSLLAIVVSFVHMAAALALFSGAAWYELGAALAMTALVDVATWALAGYFDYAARRRLARSVWIKATFGFALAISMFLNGAYLYANRPPSLPGWMSVGIAGAFAVFVPMLIGVASLIRGELEDDRLRLSPRTTYLPLSPLCATRTCARSRAPEPWRASAAGPRRAAGQSAQAAARRGCRARDRRRVRARGAGERTGAGHSGRAFRSSRHLRSDHAGGWAWYPLSRRLRNSAWAPTSILGTSPTSDSRSETAGSEETPLVWEGRPGKPRKGVGKRGKRPGRGAW